VRHALVLIVAMASATAAFAQTAAGGYAHTVILNSDGTVWTVGANGLGELGDGTQTTRRTPVAVSGLSDIVAVAAGGNHGR
jgi:alpha-tubulin suppressor-like RCC1 family protein